MHHTTNNRGKLIISEIIENVIATDLDFETIILIRYYRDGNINLNYIVTYFSAEVRRLYDDVPEVGRPVYSALPVFSRQNVLRGRGGFLLNSELHHNFV
jgi:predicted HTH domain antitoxin